MSTCESTVTAEEVVSVNKDELMMMALEMLLVVRRGDAVVLQSSVIRWQQQLHAIMATDGRPPEA